MGTKFKVKDSDPNFKKFRGQLNGGPDQVNIGLFGEQGSDLVEYAAKNEFGDQKTPERSFLRSTVDEDNRLFIRFIDKEKKNIVEGKRTRKSALKRLGIFAEGRVKLKINRGPFTPNAPFTIKKKGSSKPLIDTGRMRASIISKVK
ncbi:hypothetical protein KAR91_07950 [Candidatus Pacearchaeota archaeon]|nr:hypothetical protein [Candidatus Pacearchaeota archaeon]